MSKGRRYDGEQKLNLKKVFAVLGTLLAIVLIIFGITQILKADKNKIASKNIELNYFTVYSNGNWGVINSSGDTVIQPAYAEMIVIPNKAKPVFICITDANYVDGTYKTKAVNEKNEQLFGNYDNVLAVENYDENNKLWFEDNVLKVQKDGKFGLINLEGDEILPIEYDSITTIKGIKNSLIVKKDNKTGLVNNDGTVIVPAEYSNVIAISNDYKKGYVVKSQDGKFGVIKSDGQMALECKYDDIENIVDGNKYIVKENGTWKVVTEDGTSFLEGKVENAVDMNNGDVIVNNNGKYGVINIETDMKIPSEYESLAYMFEDKYIAKKDGKFGIINSNNETLVEFKYMNISYNKTTDYIKAQTDETSYEYMTRDLTVKLSATDETILNGYIAISINGNIKYYNYKLEEKSNRDVYPTNTLFIKVENGLFGFVDKDGKTVVEAKYEDAREQNDYGYVAVKKDGKWGALDQYGKEVVAPTYVLQNNKVIDFIGKWHVCADTNANYYTDAE